MARLRTTPHEHHYEGVLRTAALGVALAGAAGSVGLTIFQGRRNPSLLLVGMFVAWVALPFVALAISILRSKAWTFPTRVMLWGLTLTIAVSSLAVYASVVLGPPRPRPAGLFLAVPALSWLLAGTLLPLTAWLSRRR